MYQEVPAQVEVETRDRKKKKLQCVDCRGDDKSRLESVIIILLSEPTRNERSAAAVVRGVASEGDWTTNTRTHRVTARRDFRTRVPKLRWP